MKGGRRSRDKGNRAERALVRVLQDHGFAAERVPLSGSAGGRYKGDLTVSLLGIERCAEVKVRDLLIVRADRREPLVVLPLGLALDIARAAERGKAVTP
jgi:Holliday junction resolvase